MPIAVAGICIDVPLGIPGAPTMCVSVQTALPKQDNLQIRNSATATKLPTEINAKNLIGSGIFLSLYTVFI